jgi:hypothetical protein
MSWTQVAQVIAWLGDATELGAVYGEELAKHQVTGSRLLDLDDADWAALGVGHALHRRRILAAVEALREEEYEARWGAGPNDLDEFIATLDGDRIRLVARLKVTEFRNLF